MTAAALTVERFEIGRVLERVVGVLRRNFMPLAMAALLLDAVPHALGALIVLMGVHHGDWQVTDSDGQFAVVSSVFHRHGLELWLMGVIGFLASILLQPALLFGVVKDLTGRRASFTEMMEVAIRTALPVLAVGVVVAISVVIGCIFLIVPGVILGLMFCVAEPARVLEGPGILRAISRSAELTRGHRWSLLGLFLILCVVWACGGVLVGLIAGAVNLLTGGAWAYHLASGPNVGWSGWPTALIIDPLARAFGALAGLTVIASVYYELRFIKDGATPEDLLAVF